MKIIQCFISFSWNVFVNEVKSLNQQYCKALNTTFKLLGDYGYIPSEIPGEENMCRKSHWYTYQDTDYSCNEQAAESRRYKKNDIRMTLMATWETVGLIE